MVVRCKGYGTRRLMGGLPRVIHGPRRWDQLVVHTDLRSGNASLIGGFISLGLILLFFRAHGEYCGRNDDGLTGRAVFILEHASDDSRLRAT